MNKYICIRNDKIQEIINQNSEVIIEKNSSLIIVKSKNRIEHKYLIEITNNNLYENIDNLIIKNVVIEGTDGVGKTTTIKQLINEGIICQDRNDIICKYMLFEINSKTRCEKYNEYLQNNPHTILFLINNSKEELEKRINSRTHISEFDKLAYEYNQLYKTTYYDMQKYPTAKYLKLIDCTGLTLEEQIEKVKKVILEVKYE